MSDKVLSTKVPEEMVKKIKSIAEEKGESISSLLRKLLDEEILKKEVNWDSPCFGSAPREDEPEDSEAEIDETLYGE